MKKPSNSSRDLKNKKKIKPTGNKLSAEYVQRMLNLNCNFPSRYLF